MSIATTGESRSSAAAKHTRARGLALAVADVGWFNTENLFREIDRQRVSVFLLKCHDYINGWRRGLYPWSNACRLRQSSSTAWEQQLVLPSGWMKRYPRIGMRPVGRTIRQWWNSQPADCRRGLVMSYPYYLYLHDQLRPDVSLYYNIDDYTLYWPERAPQIRARASNSPRRGCHRLRVSGGTDELIAAIPEAAGRIHHVPHGAPTPFLADEPLEPRGAAARSGKASSPLSRLCRLPRRPRGLGASGQTEPRVSASVNRGGRASARARARALVGGVLTVPRGRTFTPAGARKQRSHAIIRLSTSA